MSTEDKEKFMMLNYVIAKGLINELPESEMDELWEHFEVKEEFRENILGMVVSAMAAIEKSDSPDDAIQVLVDDGCEEEMAQLILISVLKAGQQ